MSQAEPRSKPRVLVVEDDLDTRDLLTLILEDEGYYVDAVDDGRKVVDYVRNQRPDVITLDIGLPGMSGSAVLDDLEKDPVTAGIPVIVISGHTRKLGEPDREPLYPQEYGEIMAGRIALDANDAAMPHDLDAMVIGATTAREIGWRRP